MKLNELKKIIKEILKEENIFVPRNIEGRKEKLKQNLLKKLSQKIIEGSIVIDCNLIPNNYISKTEIINGIVEIKNCNSLKFFKNLKKVDGDFDCSHNKLSNLDGCPEVVNGCFFCEYNYLTTLKGCPKIVNDQFWCHDNAIEFSKKDVEKYCKVKGNIITHII